MKFIIGLVGGIVLFICSMVDGRSIYDPESIIDCSVGKYVFSVKKTDCKTTFEYKISHLTKNHSF